MEAGKKLSKRAVKKTTKDTAKTVAKQTAKETAKTTAKAAGVDVEAKDTQVTNRNCKIKFFLDKMISGDVPYRRRRVLQIDKKICKSLH